jgi:hypothetical protein
MTIDVQTDSGIRTLTIPWLAFLKHMAVAGMGYKPRLYKLRRVFGMFFLYSDYLKRGDFDNNKFSTPSRFYDPTAKSHFSNLAGLAIADILSKKINHAILTVNYETEMKLRGYKISGSRPDLISYAGSKTFATESKGLSASIIGDTKKKKIKEQSDKGPIPVNFSMASIAYNMYNKVECIYTDPPNDLNSKGNLLNLVSQEYYSGLQEFVEQINRDDVFQHSGGNFIRIPLIKFLLHDILDFPGGLTRLLMISFLHRNSINLLLPAEINSFAEKGLPENFEPFIFNWEQNENVFIDNDMVGLELIPN